MIKQGISTKCDEGRAGRFTWWYGHKIEGTSVDWGQGECWKAGNEQGRGAGQTKAESCQAEGGA